MHYIFTNGDSAGERILSLGLTEYVIPWQDVLHDGPIIATDDLSKQSHQRAKFIAKFADMDFETILEAFKERDNFLQNVPLGARLELWFEHDLYDQLQLAQILDEIHRNMPHHNVFLVQTDDFLAELSDVDFAKLPDLAQPVTEAQKAYASKIWQAFCRGVDDQLKDILEEAEPALPHLQLAMQRLCQERPDDGGLPLSMQYVLAAVAAHGEMTLGQAFQAMQESEEAKFMGDLSFSHYMDDLIAGRGPVFKSVSDPFLTVHETDPESYFDQKITLG